MRTMHSTLLVGPADWNAGRMPRAAFEARIAALWQATGAQGAIVFGNAAEHGALAYLTNFTPKLEASLAFIPRDGAPTLLVGGGINMVAAARPLTWVQDLKPLREAGKAAAEWVRGLPRGSRVLLIGGDAMPFAMRRGIDAALSGVCATEDGADALRAQMLRKDEHEMAAIRGACTILAKAVAAFRRAHVSGAGITDTLLAAERVAQQSGAQDVRSLFSPDGGRTLRPFDLPVAVHADPLQAYIAVRDAGYWAEGFVRAAGGADPVGSRAMKSLKAMIEAAQPGPPCRLLAQAAAQEDPHPLAAGLFGNGIGLSLEEAPILSTTSATTLAAGAVYSLRAGVLDGDGAIGSAMVRVTEASHEVLWSSDGAA
jgi:Xaa-Pro aminopeptidase